jgi:peptidoglycan/LPS O-acetylase OafA/YrhL
MSNSAIESQRLDTLDGWRALSILLVLGCHLLPLGPRVLKLNDTAASMGMALFFTLSGFLITRFLLSNPNLGDFLIRRLFRIVPLAWLGLVIALGFWGATPEQWWRNFTFTANWPPIELTQVASHYWSLCVEVQFYLAVALIFALAGRRGLYLLPVLAGAVTVHRVIAGTPVDIVTWRRVDEILAGATLALLLNARAFDVRPLRWLKAPGAPWVLLVALVASSHPALEAANYARPYIAALLVGSTIVQASFPGRRQLVSSPMVYIATVSYALYVIHQVLQYTWLGQGADRLEVYAKRIPLFLVLVALAHVSTFYFEKPCTEAGKRFSRRLGWVRSRTAAEH